MEYGLLGLIPVVVLMVIVLKTKKIASSLLIGTVVTFIVMEGIHFLNPFINQAYAVGMGEDYVWIVLLVVFLFMLLGFLEETGGSEAFVNLVKKKAKSAKSTLIWSWIIAIALAIDETISCAVLGTLSPVYDKYKIPWASLAYLADSTSAPFTTIIPVSAWAVFYQGVFGSYEELAYLGSPLQVYCKAIPYMFYAWAAIIIMFLFLLGIIPPLGAMKKAYKRAQTTGVLFNEESKKYNTEEAESGGAEASDRLVLKGILFLFAFLFLIVGTIITQDLLITSFVDALIVGFIALVTRLANWERLMDAAYRGILNIVPLAVILFCAFMFKESLIAIGLPDYIISVFEPIMSPKLFPFFSFLLCCILTFTTGSNWGITAVYAAIGVPLCFAVHANPILVIAAIVSGSTFGSHVCFYADYTVQAAVLTKIDTVEHAVTQLPYGLIGGALSAVGFLVAGLIAV